MSHILEPPVQRVTIPVLQRWKEEGRRISMTAAYDAVTARVVDPIVDVVLVRDRVGSVYLGFDDTFRSAWR